MAAVLHAKSQEEICERNHEECFGDMWEDVSLVVDYVSVRI